MFKKYFWRCCMAAIVFSLVVMPPAFAGKKITIRITHEVPTTSDIHRVFEEFKREAEKALPGKFDIRIYPLGQLFKDKESFDQVRMGNVEIAGGTMGTLAAVVDPRLSILDMPFLFSSFDKMRGLLSSDLGQKLNQIVGAKGFKLLGLGRSTRLGLITKDGPTRTPDALKGKLIRGFSPSVHKTMLESWGGRYTYLSAPELAHALETGVIDGIWTSVLGWTMTKDPGHYFTVFPAHAAAMYKIVSLKWWTQLPAEVKSVLEDAMNKALDYNWNVISASIEEKVLGASPFGQGKYQAYYLTEAEAEIWRKKSERVYEQLEPQFGKDLMDLAKRFSKAKAQ